MNPFVSFLHLFPPETAHTLTLKLLPYSAPFFAGGNDDAILHTQLCGLAFSNPLGLAAGFDKNAEVIVPLLKCGFGFVEAGTVTPRAQSGNPRPRLFRLPEEEAVINRLGFNNAGLEPYVARMGAAAAMRTRGIIGANVGKNKDSVDAAADYVTGVKAVSPIADYVVINISSPNTPGLRGLQNRDELTALLKAVQDARADIVRKPPLFVKIAPDLDAPARADVADVLLAAKVDGIIIGNTTLSRPPELVSPAKHEAGGLSGPPLKLLSNEVLKDMYKLTGGKLPIIGVGGIASADDAYAKIRLGASLIQLYTALVYKGPWLIADIKRGLTVMLKRDGYKNVAEAVGVDAR